MRALDPVDRRAGDAGDGLSDDMVRAVGRQNRGSPGRRAGILVLQRPCRCSDLTDRPADIFEKRVVGRPHR